MSSENTQEVSEDQTEKKVEHGPLYWFVFHSTAKLRASFKRNKRKFLLLWAVSFLVTLMCRAVWQFLALEFRKSLFVLLLISLLLKLSLSFWKREGRMAKCVVFCCVFLLAFVFAAGGTVGRYLWLYNRYERTNLQEIDQLPLSDHERIQSVNSVFALAHDAVPESESPVTPDFVRVGEEFHWTLGIEPSYPFSRTFGGVKEIFDIPGTVAAPNFSAEHRVPVHFSTGEHMMFSRNAHTATIRTLSPWRFFNYEPAEVLYFPDDKGEWIQVVSLVRWRGFLFPWPEFGGVQIIRQEEHSFLNYLKLLFLGTGTWIPPEEVHKVSYLKGQNLLSEVVSRAIADSFRFQGGFFAPLPGYHEGDVRIPELDKELNAQPFIGFFRAKDEAQGQLYHYFALEPYDVEKQGLNTSIFVPADGSDGIRVFHHLQHGQSYSGVSSISTKVMESRKDYDWNRNRPVEHRPFIKEIDGKPRFFWLTTVVTARLGKEKGKFIAGSLPEVVLTDAQSNTPIWVNPKEPEKWIERAMQEIKE